MSSERMDDSPLEPTPAEIDAWAAREHKRRQAWLSGPTEDEKRDWARRGRRRAALGLAESRLGPSPDEAEAWAARERKRRAAWLEGPTEEEKQDRAQSFGRFAFTAFSEPPLPPTAEEIEAWAARERQRRRDWADGPTEEEKRQWARRESGGLWSDLMGATGAETELFGMARRFAREAELAGKGSLYALSRAPLALWSYFVRAGRSFEDELSEQPRRSRIRF